jgi:hypothetical protein
MAIIRRELDVLSIGAPQHFRHLSVFPLVHPAPRAPFYLTLDEGLAQGTVQVTEVSKGGHVPELRFINRGDRPVLLIDGEELVIGDVPVFVVLLADESWRPEEGAGSGLTRNSNRGPGRFLVVKADPSFQRCHDVATMPVVNPGAPREPRPKNTFRAPS